LEFWKADPQKNKKGLEKRCCDRLMHRRNVVLATQKRAHEM
jgi:hypothetical protein